MSGLMRTPAGGRVDRAKPLNFTFDGRPYIGLAGDTLASALIANGVHLVGRSFKYHRPRGFLAAGSEEPNALVNIERTGGRSAPNLRATQVELYQGLVAHSQNRWPSLAFDLLALNDLAPAGLFGAGFYYKTFMAPKGAWHRLYEPFIRRTAGLGVAPKAADPDHYAHRYAFADVLVVGAGAAGLAAALAAAETGVSVMLCDEQPEMGGGLLDERNTIIDGVSASAWVASALARLRTMSNVTLLPRTQAFGYYAQNFLGLSERLVDHLAAPDAKVPRERLWKVRAKQVVLATGAIERPLVFPDNDRPGVMLASAARTYANRHGVKPGQRAVVFTADDTGYAAALDLHAAGTEIAMIADLRPIAAGPGYEAAKSAGLPMANAMVINAVSGRTRVKRVQLGTLNVNGMLTDLHWIDCDVIAMTGGWTPAVHLFSQSRGKLTYDANRQIYLPGTSPQALQSVGACNGTFDLATALAEGHAAGGGSAHHYTASGAIAPSGGFHGAVPTAGNPQKIKAFVDFQNDVTAKDIRLAVREGMHSIEHIKRYTTTGMATDQGKTSNMNGLAIASAALDKPIPDIGLTTFRPPFTPVTFGTLAGHARGDLFDPIRRTAIHGWAEAQGAAFEDVGQWKRAWYFPKENEDLHAAVNRECKAARSAAGLFDASTLGKIEVVGPDAAEFMERLYTNPWHKLGVGRCRYGLMLNEAGFVMDDGVIGRLALDRFHVTTTTGGAPRVLAHMEDYLQTEFPELKVWLTSTTEQWSVIAVQGPKAREILAPLVEGIDLSPDAMPHMSLREGKICGVPTRLFRVSFTGELGFEVNVPADYGRVVWEAIYAAGAPHGLTPYGTETMHVLRAEKGYIIIGQETDGTVTPSDLSLDWAIGKTKKDFVGKRSLRRPDLLKTDRKQLVGLLTVDPKVVLEEGAQITVEASPATGTPALGHVTSSYWSETLGRSIALALVAEGKARIGQTLHVPMPGIAVAIQVTEPIFFDKPGVRLDA
ncbi:sarcosine oxidase subunit alpha family protein [Devosia sp.]|uniref:sarcosine oxidase subunit alpha family protein n=1 Tax=Devosia sp. TaxID=1871048 RepID=UPI003263C32E